MENQINIKKDIQDFLDELIRLMKLFEKRLAKHLNEQLTGEAFLY